MKEKAIHKDEKGAHDMCTTSTAGASHERRRWLSNRFGGKRKETTKFLRVPSAKRRHLHTPTVLVAFEQGLLEAIAPDDLIEINRLSRSPEPVEPVPSFEEIANDAKHHLLVTQERDIRHWAEENPFAVFNAA